MGYVQFAMQGLRHQLSQGAANWTIDPGDRFTFYRLVDSVVPSTLGKGGHEKSFFDGIDTTWPGLAAGLESQEKKVPRLRAELAGIAKLVEEAAASANGSDASAATAPLMKVVAALNRVSSEVRGSTLNAAAKIDVLTRIADKQQQAETALNLALGVSLSADVTSKVGQHPAPKEADAQTTVSPGQEFLVAVTFHNGSKLPLVIDHIKLEVPSGWNTISGKTRPETVKAGDNLHANFRLRVPQNTKYTRPYWHRDDPQTEAVNHVDDEKYATLPFPPPALRARVEYAAAAGDAAMKNGISTVVVTPFLDDAAKQRTRPLAIVPAFSVMLEPGTQVISTHDGSTSIVAVGVTSNLPRPVQGVLRLELPSGWRSDPAQFNVALKMRGEKQDFQFKVLTTGLQEGRATVRAVLESEGEKYSEGYTLVTREDLGSFYYYQPAWQRVSIVDVQAPHDLKVGYIMGAGDDIPTVLKQVGMDVTPIPAEKIASEDLAKYQTIVLGIRAYDTQKEVVARFRLCGRHIGCAIQCQHRRLQRGQVHSLFRGTEPGASFGRRSSRGNSGAGRFRLSLSQHHHSARFRWMGAGARALLHGQVGRAFYSPAVVSRSGRRRAEGRPAARPIWPGNLHLCRICILPAVARGRPRCGAAVRQSIECER